MQAAITADKGKYIEEKMKKFRLVDMREQYADIIAEAENERMDYTDFLIRLLSVDDAGKTLRRTEMLVEKAKFDTPSNLDDIDYGFNHSLDKDKIEYLGSKHIIVIMDGQFPGLCLTVHNRGSRGGNTHHPVYGVIHHFHDQPVGINDPCPVAVGVICVLCRMTIRICFGNLSAKEIVGIMPLTPTCILHISHISVNIILMETENRPLSPLKVDCNIDIATDIHYSMH